LLAQTLATAPGLNHGVAIGGGYLFASSDTTVYRWPYTAAARADLGPYTELINGISADGNGGAPRGHTTRTLKVDTSVAGGRLFVSVGSNRNIDQDDFRSRIRYVDGVLGSQWSQPVDFSSASTWARGLRNEVGLTFDSSGVLWGVENGADNLRRDDLGGDIHNDNPGEELNRFPAPENTPETPDDAPSYGYPFCWSEFSLPDGLGLGRRTQWVWPSFQDTYSDEWCRDTDNVKPPALVMQAHTAPLGITFFGADQGTGSPPACADGGGDNGRSDAFPCSMVGDAFVSLHGSWNRDVPVGYGVVRLPFADGAPTGAIETLLAHEGPNARWPSNLRPVDSIFLSDGTLLVTSDTSGEIIRITYSPPPPPSPPPLPQLPPSPPLPPYCDLTDARADNEWCNSVERNEAECLATHVTVFEGLFRKVHRCRPRNGGCFMSTTDEDTQWCPRPRNPVCDELDEMADLRSAPSKEWCNWGQTASARKASQAACEAHYVTTYSGQSLDGSIVAKRHKCVYQAEGRACFMAQEAAFCEIQPAP